MGRTTSFNRMPRVQEPLPEEEVKIPKPPNLGSPPNFSWFQLLLPLAGLFVMVGIYGGLNNNWRLALPMVAMSGFSVAGSIVGRISQRKNYEKEVEAKKAAYASVLEQKRAKLEHLRQVQQRILNERDPDLETLLSWARNRSEKLWARRPAHADFLSLRVGIGQLPSRVTVKAPHPDMPEPRLKEAHAIESEYQMVPQVPITASIRDGAIGIAGAPKERNSIARALICNLITHHSPDEVHLLAVYSTARTDEWESLKWLPHTYALDQDVEMTYLANDSISAKDVLKGFLETLHDRENQLYVAQHGEKPPEWPWLVLLVEDYTMVRNDPAIHLLLSSDCGRLRATAIFLVEQSYDVPMACHTILESQNNGYLKISVAEAAQNAASCWPDRADPQVSEQIARALAPIQVYTLQSDEALPSNVRLFDILGIKDIANYDTTQTWRHGSSDQYLKVPIGERRGNQSMILDLDHTGHGPHGLIAGTTGSGKSELLQTLVVSLALTHHPHDVGFVLVDFKGGGAFSDLVDLPHTLGMVTDLNANLTRRALVALEAEMDRRKRLFNEAGVSDITDYQNLYWKDKVETPLPRVVVIIDEFAELVTDYPDFMDGLIGIARVGRSLGVHLILATQSPAGVVKQQIWANAKFRICLRVEDRQESMEMLHRPEAANLPRKPGRGYLQVGNNDVFELFQVARVASRYRLAGDTNPLKTKETVTISSVSPLGRRELLFDSNQSKEEKKATSVQTDMDIAVCHLQTVAKQRDLEKLPSPWPDPLPGYIPLPQLLVRKKLAGWMGKGWLCDRPALKSTSNRPLFCRQCGAPLRPEAKFCPACGSAVKMRCKNCNSLHRRGAKFCPVCGDPVSLDTSPAPVSPKPHPPTLPHRPWLNALIGLLDDPANQRQMPLMLNLAEQDGQLIMVGAPGSGKEMLARTLIVSLARTHTPDELHFYLLEFSGQALRALEDLPHVGGIFTPLDDERVRRLLRFLLDSLEQRKRLCNDAGVDGLVRLRELQPAQAPAAVVVVVTGFAEFRTLFQEELFQLTRLIREGGPYGIHVILVGDRAGDVPMAISSVVARRVVLRLASADDYAMVLGTRLRLSKDQQFPLGRGWYGRPPLEFQTATPGYEKDENQQIVELRRLAEKMDDAWDGERPQPIEKLSDYIPLSKVFERAQLPDPPYPTVQTAVPVGLDAVRLHPVMVDLDDDGPDFIIASTPKGGKTTLLQTWALALAMFNSPQQVQFVLISMQRDSLQPLRALPHVLDYCREAEEFCEDGALLHLQQEIEARERLVEKSRKRLDHLPHIVVMIDDYDALSNEVGNDTQVNDQLSTLAKEGRDVNIHTIVTGPLPKMGVGYADKVISQLKVNRSGFLLRVLDATEQNPLGLRLRAAEIKQMPAGRGYLARGGSKEMLQVATPGDDAAVARWVIEITEAWRAKEIVEAAWPQYETVPQKTDGGKG